MTTKTAVLKKVRPTNKPPYKGNYGYNVSFDNGDEGLVNAPTDQIGSLGFIVGNAVDYNIEAKQTKDGSGTWNLVTLPSSSKPSAQNPTATPSGNGSIQKAIIYQNAYTQANSHLNVVGYGNGTKDQALALLMDYADAIAKDILLKSGL